MVSGERRTDALSLQKRSDLKWDGRDVRSCSQMQKDGLKRVVCKCSVVEGSYEKTCMSI